MYFIHVMQMILTTLDAFTKEESQAQNGLCLCYLPHCFHHIEVHGLVSRNEHYRIFCAPEL